MQPDELANAVAEAVRGDDGAVDLTQPGFERNFDLCFSPLGA